MTHRKRKTGFSQISSVNIDSKEEILVIKNRSLVSRLEEKNKLLTSTQKELAETKLQLNVNRVLTENLLDYMKDQFKKNHVYSQQPD
jgi:hypothetical protein